MDKSLGTTISIGGTQIGVLTSVGSPEISADTIETTTLDVVDGYRTYIPGMMDGGEVPVVGYFDVSDSGQVALYNALNDKSLKTVIITFPATIGATWTFSAMVIKFKTGEANLDDVLGFEATFKISGKPILGITASTGASDITFVKTDGASALTNASLVPVFAIGTYFYTFTFDTETAFKPKITAASHTILIYVDGVYTESLSSGSAGSSISIGAAATKEVKAKVYEAGKTPKTYTFMVTRTA